MIHMSNIRQANPNDLAAIHKLITETLKQNVIAEKNAFASVYSDICAVLESWRGEPGESPHLVCELDGCIIGDVLISECEKLDLLFVHPGFQRKGVGRALLDAALEVCRSSGKTTLITLNSSHNALPFYLKYGFVPNGEPRDLPGGCVPLAIDL